MKNCSLILSCWSSAFPSHIILTSLQSSVFCEWQQLPFRDGLGTARHTGAKAFTINPRVVGLPPLSIYTHYTLFNSPSWAFQQSRVPRTVPCSQRTELSPPVLSSVTVAVAVTRGSAGGCPGGGGERSWHSRSWNSTRYHRAGPAGSAHSWQGGAGPRTLCSGPQRDSQ